jgi:hypothetical protein
LLPGVDIKKGGRVTLKMLRRKSKTYFENESAITQNAIALLIYLKCTAPQQKMFKIQRTQAQLFFIKKSS